MCCEKDERIAELEDHLDMMEAAFEGELARIERKIYKALDALAVGRVEKAERILWKLVE